MSIQLPNSIIQKLTHECPEIRLRFFNHIDLKINRALMHNVVIENFKPGELCKNLIRWFGFQPLQVPEKILKLLLLILSSKYRDAAISELGGPVRFMRELTKVEKLLKGCTQELVLIKKIDQILSEFKEKNDIQNVSEVPETIYEKNLNTVINEIDAAKSESNQSAELVREARFSTDDYENAWSQPSITDYNSLKIIADLLINPQSSSLELQNTLQHLQITMEDYPAEYMLQQPNIFLNLLDLFEKAEDVACPVEDIVATLLVFLKILTYRVESVQKSISYSVISSTMSVIANQLRIEKAMGLLLEKCIDNLQLQIIEFRNEITQIIEVMFYIMNIYKLLNLCIDDTYLRKIFVISDKLKKCCEENEHFTILRIKYLLFMFLLHDMTESNDLRTKSLSTSTEFLEPMLRDYTLHIAFPQRQERIKIFLLNKNMSLINKYKKLESYVQSFESAISLLKSNKKTESREIIESSGIILPSVVQLKSSKVLEILFNVIIDCTVLYPEDVILRNKAINLLLTLCQLPDDFIKEYIYNKLSQAIKRHFACLMNNEKYCNGISNDKLLQAHILGIPLNIILIQQFINQSSESSNAKVRKNCEEILIMLLKSHHLLGDKNWQIFLEILEPTLPLFQCCTYSPKIINLLLKLLDPDGHNLSLISLLKGNARFMFNPNPNIRSEALSRLIYMLNSIEGAENYLPKLIEISDVLPNDMFIFSSLRPYKSIFGVSESFVDLSTLNNLLNMLETPDIEPLIRKTSISQLNVMCQNWKLTNTFCSYGAYFLILQALENSLLKQSYTYYSDTAIPLVGILIKVLFVEKDLRNELSATVNLIVILLRAIFLYNNDVHMRQDGALCLFVLLFNNFLDVNDNESVSVPNILNNISLPLKFEIIKKASTEEENNDFIQIFSDEPEAKLFLRHLIAANFCNDYTKLNNKYVGSQGKLHDISSDLHINLRDWRLIKSTLPEQNLKRFLRAISNATEHRALINAVNTLKIHLLLCETAACIPADVDQHLFDLINKYLKLSPGNEMDFLLFENLIDLCDLCIRLQMNAIIVGILTVIATDQQHAFYILIKDSEIPLRIHYKLCKLLSHLFQRGSDLKFTNTERDANIFYSNFFDMVYLTIDQYFKNRDLLRVRCLLTLLQIVSTNNLYMTDSSLHVHCKHLVKLSIALKAFTQTGSQWQRDCLMVVCQLYEQMDEPENMSFNTSVIKYFGGLCGHNDARVRALAWCIIARVSKYNDDKTNGSDILLNELCYLPGGFLACCLSTLLDQNESILVRHLAGNLFVDLVLLSSNIDETLMLLDQHVFFQAASDSLSNAILEKTIPCYIKREQGKNIITCEIISCYARICISLLEFGSAFTNELCEKPLMLKLYELMKLPPVHDNPDYYSMCSNICQLYALIYKNNFTFLQRTLCRDPVWLMNFCQLLDQPNASDDEIINVLQLLLVICQDHNAFNHLCEKFSKAPEFLFALFNRAFTIAHINTSLQRCTLSLLCILLVKSQQELRTHDHISFPDILSISISSIEVISKDENKENNINVINSRKGKTNTKDIQCQRKNINLPATDPCQMEIATNKKVLPSNSCEPNTFAEKVFINIFHLFTHVYTTKYCKFQSPPNGTKTQITESLGLLLKLVPELHNAANKFKLLQRIIKIFELFFEDFNISCTTFVRRYGENKKVAIIKNFLLLVNILQSWFSAPSAMLCDTDLAADISKIIIQLWPWLMHSIDLKITLLRVCAFLTERSLIVCQQLSTTSSQFSNSVLQLIIKMAIAETVRVKAPTAEDFPVIVYGARTLANCSTCVEGRTVLVKQHVLDIFDSMHPYNIKSSKIKLEILHSWFQFWEFFSRHKEGSLVRNLNALCEAINKSSPRCTIRLLCLKILRNMSFHSNSRNSLLTSNDFIYTINEIISQPIHDVESLEEQLIVSVAIWQLISGGIKFVATIRGTKLAKQITILRETLLALQEGASREFQCLPYAEELLNVLNIILNFFIN